MKMLSFLWAGSSVAAVWHGLCILLIWTPGRIRRGWPRRSRLVVVVHIP